VKKAPFLITLGLFVLVAGGFFTYQYFFRKSTTTIWEMIPEQTVLIYEATECKECAPANNQSNVSQLLEKLLLTAADQDSLVKTLDVLVAPRKGRAISLHIISKDDFDAVYYFTAGQAVVFRSLINQWKETKGIRFAERELNGFKILEFSSAKRIFSCVQLGDGWAGSFTPFLIEDVVRTFGAQEEQTFKNQMSQVYALPHSKDDAGNIYVHLGNLTSLLKVFPDTFSADIMRLGEAGLLDIKQTENSITLNGFSLAQKNASNQLLSYFQNQSPVQFNIKQYISNQTMVAVNYGISDGATFYQKLNLAANKAVLDSLHALAIIDYPGLFSSLGKELSICFQESRGDVSKIVVFETQKPKEWVNAFDLLSEASRKEDTVFHERYSTYEIKEIEISNFTGKLFSPLISGSAHTYYSSIGNYMVLSENIESMKRFLEDIDQENVWGKSVTFNKFTESTLLEANFSVYVNTPLVWSSITEKLGPRWKEFVRENQPLLNSFDFGAIQFSNLNETFYTNITWTYSEFADKDNRKPARSSDRLVASLGSAIISHPTVVKSHVNGDDEVLVQDSAYVLYHLSADGKVLWQKELNERIVGEIHQVDFFMNGKLQFFFSTSGHLHIIDRLGNYVNPYPQEIKIRDPEYVALVDYDKSKKYRFLLADKSGKLWMFDKEAKNLEGWTPKNVEGELIAPAKHYRIRGKDYILAIRKDGYAYLSTRRGETIKGFPLNLEARPNGDFYLEAGNTLATTSFVCISRDGFRIRFNLDGKIMSRETLIRPSFETQFSLVPEQSGKSYVILQQDTKKLTVLNEDGKEIFSNAYVGTNRAEVKYYDFGAGKIYFTITDLEQELSFIYDESGRLLNPTPLEGRAIELRPTRNEMPKIFMVDLNALIIQ
jgi:hypothetical protein